MMKTGISKIVKNLRAIPGDTARLVDKDVIVTIYHVDLWGPAYNCRIDYWYMLDEKCHSFDNNDVDSGLVELL